MAEDDEFPSERFRKKQENSLDDDNSDAEDHIRLDLGIDSSKNFDMVTVSEEGAVAGRAYIYIRINIYPFVIHLYKKF